MEQERERLSFDPATFKVVIKTREDVSCSQRESSLVYTYTLEAKSKHKTAEWEADGKTRGIGLTINTGRI